MKKGKWSKEEDRLIKKHIEKYGIGRSWQSLSNTLGLQRCGRSCRSRWLNYLRPGLKHGNFTQAEERVICEMYSKRGSSWSVIAAQLPGRTDLAIKNYWNSTLKKRFPVARGPGVRCKHQRPSASTSSDAATHDRAIIVYGEENISTGSSAHSDMDYPALSGSSLVHPDAIGIAGEEEPITAVLISGPVRIERNPAMESLPLVKTSSPPLTLPPLGDRTGGMDIICCPMSPLPLAFLEPELENIVGFDDIDSYLYWFDD